MDLKHRQRFVLCIFFFLSGFCFATWASRIPTIKAQFLLNDAQLGTLLLAMPISSLAGLPISGWLISRFDSRIPLTIAFVMNALALCLIGFASSIFWLVPCISLLAFSIRILNISQNTQALTLQKQFDKTINGTFHGLWSTGGIAGVSFSTAMVGLDVGMKLHVTIVAGFSVLTALYCSQFLLRNDRASTGNKFVFGKPDPYILFLGLIVFLAAVCEGGMFDWSGVYFRDVLKVNIFTTGYLTFMVFMAVSRFLSDSIVARIGMQKTYVLSGMLIGLGIFIALAFPSLWSALVGFSMVGFGTASVVPMTFTLAGKHKTYSAGMAVSILSTYLIAGMLLGPPLIGYLSHAFSLRVSFITFGLCGILMIPMSKLFFKHVAKEGLN